ncbi:MAG: hypothetical protein A2W93_01115 [Bacteroidetes bacterium GWF2_43_63]|nr:MAG: hypothetical protein A2W94_11515 [Bacteroidetes bacterium GWE2_42_42]OFY54714.1 MAG: hypothetical protein A2W93_01115 [Bacteroidetes bacterium GWF2_43_63]HBG69712.1 YigZ family protein [Bacteroidales bacterium]HCB63129.1 YigZ family protein [Bacteroidales bacterium]HCY22152.1 YigZ family protein [Bacteroidales bacterium]
MADVFLTIQKPAQATFKDRNSRFIGLVFPVDNETQVKEIQAQLRKEYYDARHHCFAYILGFEKEIFRANDDGEPSGSAGKPIHNQLLSSGVTNVLAVVVRYFGGTKLGVPGLIHAYKTATSLALDEAGIVEKHTARTLQLSFTYPEINTVMQIVQTDGVKIQSQIFDNNCSMELLARESIINIISSKLEKAGITCEISSGLMVF